MPFWENCTLSTYAHTAKLLLCWGCRCTASFSSSTSLPKCLSLKVKGYKALGGDRNLSKFISVQIPPLWHDDPRKLC
jgi:hypothetical protein